MKEIWGIMSQVFLEGADTLMQGIFGDEVASFIKENIWGYGARC